MNKLLSVIVPTYNMEAYLDRCLSSLIVPEKQLNNLEVIVINDGSKDRSSEIAHSYESKYPETFRVIDKENGNYGSCVNRGVLEATGKYIKILDADDWFDTEVFSEYLTFLETLEVDFVFNGMSMVNSDSKVTGHYCFESVLGGTSKMTMEEYASRMNGVGLYMQNVAYRTECLRQMRYVQTEGISYTDQEWLFTPLFATKSVAYFPKSLYQYLVGRNGQTIDTDVHIRNMWMEVKVTKSMISSYAERIKGVGNDTVAQYIRGRLMARVRYVYVVFLLSCRDKLDINDLIDFDRFLYDSDSELYAASNDISARFGLKYIKNWRRSYSDRTLLFFLIRIKQKLRPSPIEL